MRYQRHFSLPNFETKHQEQIGITTILLIGMGGLGCAVAPYLAGAGVGRLILIDDDKVDTSNLHRQILYAENDVGNLKVDVAKRFLLGRNSIIDIVTHPIRVSNTNIMELIREGDLVIDGSDNFATRYLVNDACVLANKPLISGSVSRMEGQVVYFQNRAGKHDAHYRDLFPEPPKEGVVENCETAGVLGPVVALIGSMMATEALLFAAGMDSALKGRMMYVDAQTMRFNSIKLPSRSDHPIRKLPDNAAFCLPVNRLVSWDEAKEAGLAIVDVRSEHEHNSWNNGGINIPLDELDRRWDELKEISAIGFYCQTGLRSEKAVQLYGESGLKGQAYSIKGGMLAAE